VARTCTGGRPGGQNVGQGDRHGYGRDKFARGKVTSHKRPAGNQHACAAQRLLQGHGIERKHRTTRCKVGAWHRGGGPDCPVIGPGSVGQTHHPAQVQWGCDLSGQFRRADRQQMVLRQHDAGCRQLGGVEQAQIKRDAFKVRWRFQRRYRDFKPRQAGAQLRQARCKPKLRQRRKCRDMDPARRRVLSQGSRRFGHRVKCRRQGRKRPCADIGQADPARMAFKQRRPDIGLQRLDLRGYCACGHAQFLGGHGETTQTGGGLERAQRVQRGQARMRRGNGHG